MQKERYKYFKYRDEMKNMLQEYVDEICEPAEVYGKRSAMYICPFCDSGTGHNHTAAFCVNPDGIHYKCFACGENGDIFDLIAHEYDLKSGSREVFETAYRILIEENTIAKKPELQRKKLRKDEGTAKISTQTKRSYKEYLKRCIQDLPLTSYMKERGFSDEILKRCCVGYDQWRRMITIPYSREYDYYIARMIDSKNYYKLPGIEEPIYNEASLYHGEGVCFVTEGQLDAMSFLELGYPFVIALGSMTNVQKLVRLLEQKPTNKMLILALDNDEAGRKAQVKLAEELKKRNIPYLSADIYGEFKDANECLVQEREQFQVRIQEFLDKYELEGESINDEI